MELVNFLGRMIIIATAVAWGYHANQIGKDIGDKSYTKLLKFAIALFIGELLRVL